MWVRVPRLPLLRAHGPTGRRRSCKPEIRVRFPVSPLFHSDTVPWSNGEDSWPTPRQRWFESIRGHWKRVRTTEPQRNRNAAGCPSVCCAALSLGPLWLGRQLADHPHLERRMLRVRLPPEPLSTGVCGGAESSSPCHGEGRGFESRQARLNGTVRKLAKRRSSNLRDFAGSTPALATGNSRRLGIGVPKWL